MWETISFCLRRYLFRPPNGKGGGCLNGWRIEKLKRKIRIGWVGLLYPLFCTPTSVAITNSCKKPLWDAFVIQIQWIWIYYKDAIFWKICSILHLNYHALKKGLRYVIVNIYKKRKWTSSSELMDGYLPRSSYCCLAKHEIKIVNMNEIFVPTRYRNSQICTTGSNWIS